MKLKEKVREQGGRDRDMIFRTRVRDGGEYLIKPGR